MARSVAGFVTRTTGLVVTGVDAVTEVVVVVTDCVCVVVGRTPGLHAVAMTTRMIDALRTLGSPLEERSYSWVVLIGSHRGRLDLSLKELRPDLAA